MVTVLLAGCPQPRVPSAPTGGLRLRAEPAEARIYVNEQLVGTVETYTSRPLLLVPGDYRVKIVMDGYYPEYREVAVEDEVIDLDVSLVPVPEPIGVDIE